MKSSKGFTLIESLVGIFLVAIGSAALFLGLTQSQITLESIRIKDQAHQELKEYTENIKGMVASGVETFGSEGSGGKVVVLKASEDGTAIVTGRLNKEVRKSTNSGDYSVYYYIKTNIIWDRTLFENNIPDTLEFKTYQVRLSL